MDILGIIIIIVGIALILAGRLTSRSLPPNYDANEDQGFLELLQSVGKMLAIVGIVFILGGIVFLCL